MKTKLVKVDEVKIESLIKKNFSEEFMKKIYDIYSDDCMSIVEKTILFDKIFTEEFGQIILSFLLYSSNHLNIYHKFFS